jgi:hypothetical protein
MEETERRRIHKLVRRGVAEIFCGRKRPRDLEV